MKKIISQISLILLIMIIGMLSVCVTEVYAANATIAVSSTNIKKGDTFTVTVNIPSNAVAYEGKIKVYYKNGGITDTSSKLTKVTGLEGDFAHPGNMTATFTAKATGEAVISVEECVIGDRESNSLPNPASITINIADNTPPPSTPPTTPSTPSTPSTPTTPSTKPSEGNSGTGTTSGPKFTDVNETVYTTTRCNLRESYSTSSNKVATVNANTKLTRKGIGDNGWSKLEYNGKTVYASSEYLTTTNPNPSEEKPEEKEPEVTFKDTEENLYAKQDCNLRASWTTDSDKVGYLKKGQEVKRTGYADNGWSRILYNGKTVYVASRLLVVDKPEENTVSNTTNTNTVKNEIANQVSNNVVTNNTVNKVKNEAEILNEIKEEVGVLPEVGTNAANVAYIVVTLMAVCGVIAGIIYLKKFK